MDNSLVTHLSAYVEAMFKDIKPTYTSAKEWERDQTRLTHELANRGLRTLAIDLPALCKHFVKCLEQKHYSRSGLYLSRCKSAGVQLPLFMADLYLQVFDEQGVLREDPSVTAISDIYQMLNGLKKVRFDCNRKVISDEVKNFKDIEDSLRDPDLNWNGSDAIITDSDRAVGSKRVHFCDAITTYGIRDGMQGGDRVDERFPDVLHATILQQVCDRIFSGFGDLHIEDPRELPKHGKGRVSNHPKGVSKYHFTEWPDKLDAIFPHDLYARTDFGVGQDHERDRGRLLQKLEHPSKLIAVPKTLSGPRLIASETNQNQFIQQLLRKQIETRLMSTPLRNCVTFGLQAPNQVLALLSSASGTHCTVDLKNASDRLTCWTVERALRSNKTLLDRIHASRSSKLDNCVNDDHFKTIVLKKAFTQGSGCNFPVQTVIYACMAISSVILSRKQKVTKRTLEDASNEVHIFGDDIIVPGYALVSLVSILEANQLRYNPSKTFHQGKFRESCGCDAYDGVDITPVYIRTIKTRPDHEDAQSAIETCNNLYKRGLWNLSKWLESTIRRFKLPIVHYRETANGLISFVGQSFDHLKKRYNGRLHKEEYYYHRLTNKTKKVETAGTYRLFQYFIERPEPTNKWESGTIGATTSVMRLGWY